MTAEGSEFETVIGLEVHCQLRTASKAFCACPTRFGDAPNTQTCPTCLGLPGTLPAYNAHALELGLRLALAMGCTIRERSVFARKNYFYPDLPKGYQISQHDEPMAEGGSLEVETPDGPFVARLVRIHLEEDAGKSLHEASPTSSFVDYNRAGVPLAEVVTQPDFRTPAQAHAWLTALRQLVRYLGVSDGNMEQGSLRCDCNVSLRARGETRLGTKVELKNLNSFRSVVRALEHEVGRQAALLRAGQAVEHGTRLWDEAAGVTRRMRSKEMAHDYRYFPDPDLLPVAVDAALLARVRRDLPELPSARRARLVAEMGLTPYDAGVLTASKAVADFYEAVASSCGDARAASNWVQGEVLRELKERNADLEADDVAFPVSVEQLAGLVRLVAGGDVSISAAKQVFAAMSGTGREPSAVVDELGLRQVSDETALRALVRQALDASASAVADYRGGNERTFGFLVGQAMKATRGQGHPATVSRLVREELDRSA